MDLAVIAITFGTIFVVELPDKTFIAALVLSTRYRPFFVWIGVGLAFLVQTVIAVAAGGVATLLPEELIKAFTLVVFLVGAVLLYRAAPGADAEEAEQEERYGASTADARTGMKVVVSSFLLLFAAEWGDLSQLLTISLVAKYHAWPSVFIGAWGALLTVSGLAAVAGRVLLNHVRLSVIHYVGAGVCLVLAAVTGVELVRAITT